MSNRFDPDKVEWPDGDTGPKQFKAWPLDREMVEVEVVPLPTYRELYEAANQMAEAFENLERAGLFGPVEALDALDKAITNFRGESESNAD